MSSLARILNHRLGRIAVVVAGIVLGQTLLYGPCLLGMRVMLPLDILGQPDVYLPATPDYRGIPETDSTYSDLILSHEPARRFMAGEFRAGRWPVWNPNNFAGAPFIWPTYSPFVLIACASRSPVVIAWMHLAVALVAGLGMYVFARRILKVSFWPAAIGGWAYPLTGFFVLWQGWWLPTTVCWLPWLLLAVHRVVTHFSLRAVAQMALATAVVVVSGQIDIAGQVLLIAGIFGLGSLVIAQRSGIKVKTLTQVAAGLVVAWTLGISLTAPYLIPAVSYAKTGNRMLTRATGNEERPPAGVTALPLLALPDHFGRSTTGSLLTVPFQPNNLQESVVGAYAGGVALLVLVWLAFGRKDQRREAYLLAGIGLLGVGWCLDFPGLVDILRLPGINMMSHNRLTFAAAFAITALMTMGAEQLMQTPARRWRWHWLLVVLPVALAVWCFHHAVRLPESITSELPRMIAAGQRVVWLQNAADVLVVQDWYRRHFIVAGIFCALAAVGAGLLGRGETGRRISLPLFGGLLLADLLWFAHGRSPQADPKYYFPKLPALEAIAQAEPGRVLGYGCLPANLTSLAGLRDIRGYDGVDPKRLLDVLALARSPLTPEVNYATTIMYIPNLGPGANDHVTLPPVLDLLGVRYLIMHGEPRQGVAPRFRSAGYFVLENTNALPRVFVPEQVETVPAGTAVQRMNDPAFDPRKVAYVEGRSAMDHSGCRGQVRIVAESPTQSELEAQMETAGVVVIADLWDEGWRARVNGVPAEILRADHALRAIKVQPGANRIELDYRPAGWHRAITIATVAGVVVLGLFLWRRRNPSASSHPA